MTEDVSLSPSLTASQLQWLEHLKTWQEQGVTLKNYALTHGLSLSGLYTAKRVFKRRGIWRGRSANKPPSNSTSCRLRYRYCVTSAVSTAARSAPDTW